MKNEGKIFFWEIILQQVFHLTESRQKFTLAVVTSVNSI